MKMTYEGQEFEVGEVQVMRLEPDDVVVIRTRDYYNWRYQESMLKMAKEVFPNNNVMFLRLPDTVEVVRPSEVVPDATVTAPNAE